MCRDFHVKAAGAWLVLAGCLSSSPPAQPVGTAAPERGTHEQEPAHARRCATVAAAPVTIDNAAGATIDLCESIASGIAAAAHGAGALPAYRMHVRVAALDESVACKLEVRLSDNGKVVVSLDVGAQVQPEPREPTALAQRECIVALVTDTVEHKLLPTVAKRSSTTPAPTGPAIGPTPTTP